MSVHESVNYARVYALEHKIGRFARNSRENRLNKCLFLGTSFSLHVSMLWRIIFWFLRVAMHENTFRCLHVSVHGRITCLRMRSASVCCLFVCLFLHCEVQSYIVFTRDCERGERGIRADEAEQHLNLLIMSAYVSIAVVCTHAETQEKSEAWYTRHNLALTIS